MSDWTGVAFSGGTIAIPGASAGGASADMDAARAAANASTTWPAANRALFSPIVVSTTTTFLQMAVIVGTQSGNLDVGIYDELGNRLVSAGSTAVAAAGVQVVNIGDTTVGPGCYFLAMSCDNTTAAFQAVTVPVGLLLQTMGVQQQALGSVTLPDPATFANPASAFVPAVFVSTMQATI